MVTLSVFGGLDIQDAVHGSVEPLLAQTKRAALVAYLAVGHAGTLCRRDHLLALFWPDLDDDHGRHALSQALTYIRRHLGPEVVATRGKDEVGVDGNHLTCDVSRFEEAARAGDWERALELYTGDLLEGLHVAGAPDFSDWVDRERYRLREVAREVEWTAAHACLSEGRTVEAERHATRGLVLSPTDERPVQDFIAALARAGDRGAALGFYDTFAAHLERALGVEPGAQTLELVAAIRQGELRPATAPASLSPPAGSAPSHAPSLVDGAASPPETGGGPGARPTRKRRGLLLKLLVGLALPLLAWVLVTAMDGPRSPAVTANLIIVPPFENHSGDSDLDDVADLAAQWVGDAIQQVSGAQVVPSSAARRFLVEARERGAADPVQAAAQRARAGWVVRGALLNLGDSVELRVEIQEDVHRTTRQRVVEAGPRDELNLIMDRLGRRAAGALSYEFDPWMKEAEPELSPLPAPPTLEAFREHRLGYEAYNRADRAASFRHHMRAFRMDTTMVRAAVAAAYMTDDRVVQDSLAAFAEQRRSRLTAKGRLDLDILHSLGSNDLAGGLRAIRASARMEAGGFSSVLVSWFAARMNLPAAGLAATDEYDPDVEWRQEEAHAFWGERCKSLHMLGRYEEELAEARQGRVRYPANVRLRNAEIRALAALDRVDEAVALLLEGRALPERQIVMALEAGLELRAHGHPEASSESFRWAAEWLATSGRGGSPDAQGDGLALAEALYGAGRWAEAKEVAGAFLEESPDDLAATGLLGLAAARLGEEAVASEVVDRLSGMERRYQGGQHLLLMASISAVLGHTDEAMKLLYQATADGLPFGLWIHRDMNLETLRARDDFRALVAPKG